MPIRVLIADDHEIFREGLRALLSQNPDVEVVAESGNGLSAVQNALELLPDVALLDINMPELNGIEAARRISASGCNVKTLIFSMEMDRSIVISALEAGATGYLLKECAFAELTTAIRTIFGGEPYLSPKIANLVIKEYMNRNKEVNDSEKPLTEREHTVLKLIADGRNTKEIAATCGVSLKTIDSQRHSIMKKLGLYSIAELTKYAVRKGLSEL